MTIWHLEMKRAHNAQRKTCFTTSVNSAGFLPWFIFGQHNAMKDGCDNNSGFRFIVAISGDVLYKHLFLVIKMSIYWFSHVEIYILVFITPMSCTSTHLLSRHLGILIRFSCNIYETLVLIRRAY